LHSHEEHEPGRRLDRKTLLLGLGSLLWLVLRTGTKPSRAAYPCQRAAAANVTTMFSLAVVPLFVTLPRKISSLLTSRKTKAVFFVVIALLSVPLWIDILPASAGGTVQLVLNPSSATQFPASDIFVVNNRSGSDSGITELVNLMGTHGLLFYNSSTSGPNQGPDGLIAKDDIVLIKVNGQWLERGNTNTDAVKGIIQAIIDHPDGFIGEIVVVENTQGMRTIWPDLGTQNNAEDITQSIQDVVNYFAASHNVSTFRWDSIRNTAVAEYSAGNMNNGYVVYPSVDPTTGILVSYPKFKTDFNTYISFKYGIWNTTTSTYDKTKFKVINVPVLKSHSYMGVTGAIKHYMGIISTSPSRDQTHGKVSTGGMGTLMVETTFPTLNIIDAIYVNAIPLAGPETSYDQATKVNVVMASRDPVALDYWAAKHVLMQTAQSLGYTDLRSLNPDHTENSGESGDGAEVFGVWLRRSKNVLGNASYQVTMNEAQMNVYVAPEQPSEVSVNSVVVRSTSSPSQVSSTDPWTEYYANASITTTKTFGNLLNVTWVFNSSDVAEGAPDNVRNHYTFKWTPAEGFREITTTGHLIAENSVNASLSSSSGWFRLAFRFGKTANKTNWTCRVTAYLNATTSSSKKSSPWAMNTYIGFSLSAASVNWDGLPNYSNVSASSMPLNINITSNVNVKIQVRGDGDLKNGSNSIPLSNVYVSQTNTPSGDGKKLTTTYQDWKTSIPPTEGGIHPSYWFLTIPLGTPSGTYRFTFYVEVSEQT